MKVWMRFVGIAAVLLLAAPVFAGSGDKCGMSAQACLDEFGTMRAGGWAGLTYDKNEKGEVVVKQVAENGPAAGKLQVGDVLVAVNGAKFTDKAALKKAKKDWKPGSEVSYTVSRGGAEQQVAVTLAPMPEEVFASMVGNHMVYDHMVAAPAVKAENPTK